MPVKLRYGALVLVAFSVSAACRDKDLNRETCPRQPQRFAEIQDQAGRHNAHAETILASCYELGMHVMPNRGETIRWLTLAAQQAYAPAQSELGRIYLYGRGVPSDYVHALFWTEKAARQGDAVAQRNIAYMFERGLGVQPDPAKAAEWNQKAAWQGNAQAQLSLAQALEKGLGIKEDADQASFWYRKAAEQNLGEAQLRLGQLYAQSARRCSTSLFWYRRAAKNAQSQAMYDLGKLYQTSCGPNPEQAFIWFRLGSRFGSSASQRAADALSASLTDSQKARAENLVNQWIAKYSASRPEDDND